MGFGIKATIKDFYLQTSHWHQMRKYSKKKTVEWYKNRILKSSHSIERGLSLSNCRYGFGADKIDRLISLCELYSDFEESDKYIIKLAVDVLNAYFIFNKEHCYSDESLKKNKEKFNAFLQRIQFEEEKKNFGGVQNYIPAQAHVSYSELEKCIQTRHSIRQFKQEPVDQKALKDAINLALKAPSACNRQATRVYILDKNKFSILTDFLAGTRGFLDEVDKILIVTGKLSAYEIGEKYQYIVSPSILVGYLSLTLHAKGLGSCILQRDLLSTKKWRKLADKIGAQEDEQMVCMLAVGVPKDNILVPVSKRLQYEDMVKEVL